MATLNKAADSHTSGGRSLAELHAFSFDRLLDAAAPSDLTMTIVKVKGSFGYCPQSGVRHGDILAVVDEITGDPDDLMLVRLGRAHHIRTKRAADAIHASYARLRLIGQNGVEKRPVVEIIGRILCVFRLLARKV